MNGVLAMLDCYPRRPNAPIRWLPSSWLITRRRNSSSSDLSIGSFPRTEFDGIGSMGSIRTFETSAPRVSLSNWLDYATSSGAPRLIKMPIAIGREKREMMMTLGLLPSGLIERITEARQRGRKGMMEDLQDKQVPITSSDPPGM